MEIKMMIIRHSTLVAADEYQIRIIDGDKWVAIPTVATSPVELLNITQGVFDSMRFATGNRVTFKPIYHYC